MSTGRATTAETRSPNANRSLARDPARSQHVRPVRPRENRCYSKSKKAQQHIAQHGHHLVVLADHQQAEERKSQRHHQPARVDAGQQSDYGRSGLEIGRDRDHIDEHNRRQEDRTHTMAVALHGQPLQVGARHGSDMGRDRQNHPQKGGRQAARPRRAGRRFGPRRRQPCRRWSGRCPRLPRAPPGQCSPTTPVVDWAAAALASSRSRPACLQDGRL